MHVVDRTGRNGPVFNVLPEDGDRPAEIVMYGDIWETVPTDWFTGEPIDGMYIALDETLERIKEVEGASEIVIRLNSSGGDADVGIAIYNLLRTFPGRKVVVVEGMAASAASLIMCAGDVVRVHPSSEVFIHAPGCLVNDFMQTSDVQLLLNDCLAREKAMKNIYSEKTGMGDDELQEVIDANTWYIGQEAIDAGFADELIETATEMEPPEVVDGGDALLVAGVKHRMYNLANVPAWLTGGERGRKTMENSAKETPSKEDEVQITNADELKAAYPDFVAQLINEATAKAVVTERGRIRDIESIAATLDPDVVARAKFDEPMTAQELAFNAAKIQAKLGAEMLDATDRDRDDSGSGDVDPDPNGGNEGDDNNDEEERRMVRETITETVRVYNDAKRVANGMKGAE